MNDCTRSRGSTPAAGEPTGSDTDVEHLLRMLLAATRSEQRERHAARSESDGEEIVFDLDIDGCRFMLVRMPRPERERAHLSPREQEIARMVAAGYPSKTIASVLNISSWTVGTHLRRIFAKLGVKTRAAMVGRLHEIGVAAHGRATTSGLSETFEADERKPSDNSVPRDLATNRRARVPVDAQ